MENRQRQLQKSSSSLFLSYSHGDDTHMKWVSNLADDLRRADIDVVLDRNENPAPADPGPNASHHEFFAHRLGIGACKYIGAAQRWYGVAPKVLLRASPVLPKDIESRLSEAWKRHIERIPDVIHLAVSCRNFVIVYTPRYQQECQPTAVEGEAGWVLDELRTILDTIRRSDSPCRLIVVLRGGVESPVSLGGRIFPFVDFSEDRTYADRLQTLLAMLSSERGPVDWCEIEKQTRERIQCLECDLAIPYPRPHPVVCLNCGTIRPVERLLCPRCDYNLSYALDVPRSTAPGEIIDGPMVRRPGTSVLTNRCPQCRRGKLLWYEASS